MGEVELGLPSRRMHLGEVHLLSAGEERVHNSRDHRQSPVRGRKPDGVREAIQRLPDEDLDDDRYRLHVRDHIR